MKQSAKLIFLVLLLGAAHLGKAQQEESDVADADSPGVDEQNGSNQPSGGNRVGRIYTGVNAASANQPYAAVLSLNSGSTSTKAMGAIISNTTVLTSASAVLSAGSITAITVVVGSSPGILGGTFRYDYKGYELHSGFDSATLANDVAIITMGSSFAGLTNVQPIAMATTEIAVSTTTRTKCVVLGWGQTTSTTTNFRLSQADYELLTDQECATEFKQSLPSSLLCARSVSGYACNMDGGAPLVCNGQLYGILTNQTGCTASSTPKIQKFAKLPVIRIPWNIPTISNPPRKNYVSCP
ncbi:hypothetical protein AND_003696 [Anopheles darlingi]|uniref:Peptidase S1 domain-containing protein n=1 Tax=Anopheles darlingi TaxID=43151 RepID=W5JMM1_ANODA|nr:hypothetical protein AND_003696 [Anopheles darlingi]